MSRLTLALAGVTLLLGNAAHAQNAASDVDRKVEDLLATQKATTDLSDKRCALGDSSAREIVVCRPRDRDKDRFPGREDSEAARSTRTGVPRAPNFAKPSCKGQPGCVMFGKVPPPMPDIDIAALPAAPPGSDADKIARGEMKAP